ncbi:MAG: COX15/CtaA family protein [Lysobacteraceae bacterium]
MNAPSRHFHRIAWAAVALALVVILFGAFVRLSNAGLSCPDWPTCYGKATWPKLHEVDAANAAFPERLVERGKAWREQVHRHIAALLGALVFALALLAARQRRGGLAAVLGSAALVAVSIPLYMKQAYVASSLLAAGGEAILLACAWRWDNRDFARISAVALAVIVFQAMLGMWTVTWLLKPIVVMAHLLGGLATFSLLLWIAWRASPSTQLLAGEARALKKLVWLGLALLAAQIALGGWTSANYAALSCGTDFPICLGRWWPAMDFSEAFVLWRGIGVDYEGGVLDGAARSAIQMTHRLAAIVVSVYLLFLAWRLHRAPGLGHWGWTLILALVVQVTLGIGNVMLGLPLWVAVAHTAGAVLLLALLVGLLARLRPPLP